MVTYFTSHLRSTYRLALIFCILPGLLLPASVSPPEPAHIPPGSRSDSIDVVHYTLSLTIVNLSSGKISGNTDLEIVVKRDNLDTIVLDLAGLVVDSIWLDDVSVPGFRYDGRWIRLPVPAGLARNTPVLVSVFYHGKPARDPRWGGVYFSGNTAFSMGIGMQSHPQCFGRAWFPCVDNFIDRATYNYFITVEKDLTAVCSGILEEIYENTNGTRTFFWSQKHEIPTYLSSVAVSRYLHIADTLQGISRRVPCSIYVNHADSLKAIRTFRNLDKYLKWYERLFGPYRWERIGYVAVPFRGGAMEHAENITFSNRLLNNPSEAEKIMIHEFAHNWFGNLVTCRTAGDMWLNEGWAGYAVALYLEREFGKERFQDHVRENHHNVLKNTHVTDQGYYPVCGIPHHLTYSSTVYDRGADMAHALRGYLGDEKFFSVLKQYFRVFAFRDISTAQFQEFFDRLSETDLTDFFNGWIYGAGFPHFSADSFHVRKTEAGYNARVYFRQELRGTDHLTYSNRIEITFMDEKWRSHTLTASVSGRHSVQSFFVPFKPSILLVDLEQKTPDATTDLYRIIRTPGSYEFNTTYCRIHVRHMADSALVRVIHHWVAPDPPKSPASGSGLSTVRYWSVEGIFPASFSAGATFFYNTAGSPRSEPLDSDMTDLPDTSIVLLYREGAAHDWGVCDFSRKSSAGSGEFTVNNLKPGEYSLGYKITGDP